MTDPAPLAQRIAELQQRAETELRDTPIAAILRDMLAAMAELAAIERIGTLTPAEFEAMAGGARFLASLNMGLARIHAAREHDVERTVRHILAAAQPPQKPQDAP